MNGVSKLWEELFKVSPGLAIVLLVFGLWHLFLKDLFSGGKNTPPPRPENVTPNSEQSHPAPANPAVEKTPPAPKARCVTCRTIILATTAAATGGKCMPCFRGKRKKGDWKWAP